MTAVEWTERRSFHHSEFADIDSLARRKEALGLSVSVVLPGREVATTVGPVVRSVGSLRDSAGLVDQLVVIDGGSSDATALLAAREGAEVYAEDDLLPWLGPALGKGDAMWRALSVASGDVVVYLDADTVDFGGRFVYGLLGPLLAFAELRFVKAAYRRRSGPRPPGSEEGGGRVTELMARPLLNLFYPELCGFAQPLAGELAAYRELLCEIPFFTGYAVEIGMLIDVWRAVGTDAMAQVDVKSRANPSQPLRDLGPMSYAVLLAVESRLRSEGRLASESVDGGGAGDRYLQALCDAEGTRIDTSREVQVVERPPMRALVAGGAAGGR
jgi:glucosyl-3-phosphoglycerate synthase